MGESTTRIIPFRTNVREYHQVSPYNYIELMVGATILVGRVGA